MRLLLGVLCYCLLLSRVMGSMVYTAPGDEDSQCNPDVIPNTAVLLDSRNYQDLGRWTASDVSNDGNNWIINSPPTPCNNTWQYCRAATSDLDTLTTQMINTSTAEGQSLTIEVEFEFFNHTTDTCPLQQFQLLIVNGQDADPIGTITCGSMSPKTFMYPSPAQIFQLRFEANFTEEGACVTFYRVRVYYPTAPCPSETIMYATYPMTNHGEVGMGMCVSNSEPGNGASLMLSCRNGTFVNPVSAGGCLCSAGYEASGSSCTACNTTSYKPLAGNTDMCVLCPANSRAPGPASNSCQCIPGYRRANVMDITSDCNECVADYRRLSNGTCISCPTNSLRTIQMDEGSCTCQDNRATASENATTSGEPCDGCLPTHYLSGGNCMLCPLNSRAPNHDDSECMCNGDTATANGMTTTTIEACGGCAENFFIPNGGSCTRCPSNSDRTGDDLSRCVCNTGMATSSGQTVTSRASDECNACAANFYMDSGSCVPCPNNTMRAFGGDESGCSCSAGYVRTTGASTTTQCFAVVGFLQQSMAVSESENFTGITVELSALASIIVTVTSDITSGVGTIAPTTLVFTSAGPTTRRITAVLLNNNVAVVEDPVFMINLEVATGSAMVGGIVRGTEYFETLSLTVVDDDRTTPDPPTMVGGSPVNSTAIRLIWQAPDNSGGIGVDNYNVSYQAGNGRTISITVSGQTTSYTVGNLEPGTEYTFTVSAVNRLGPSTVARTTVTTPGTPQPAAFPIGAIIGIAAGGALAILVVLMILICVVICRFRVNRRGFYPTYEDKASEPPTMLRYSASLRSISSQTVVPSDARMATKENEFYV